MGLEPKSPTPVYEDNTACIECHDEWTNNVIGGRERAKHIDTRKHFALQAAQLGHLRLYRVSTADELADVFTRVSSRNNMLRVLLGSSDARGRTREGPRSSPGET